MASNGSFNSWQAHVVAALAAASARISAIVRSRFGPILVLLLLPGLSIAQSYNYHVLIDSDLRSTTGCEVLLANGERRMTGAEWRMTAVGAACRREWCRNRSLRARAATSLPQRRKAIATRWA